METADTVALVLVAMCFPTLILWTLWHDARWRRLDELRRYAASPEHAERNRTAAAWRDKDGVWHVNQPNAAKGTAAPAENDAGRGE